jgi:hypothetical protein
MDNRGESQDLSTYVPRYVNERLGVAKIGKGKIEGSNGLMLYYAWDAVPDCIKERCQAYALCTYMKAGSCNFIKEGLKGLSLILFRNFADTLTEDVLFRVGMHLMPLYKSLLKLNIQELAVERAVYADDKGMYRAHPIYKEIRETIKQLEFAWKTLGLTQPDKKPLKDPLEHGDPNFVKELEAASEVRTETTRKLIRRKKLDKAKEEH